jgi:hypothetical protein
MIHVQQELPLLIFLLHITSWKAKESNHHDTSPALYSILFIAPNFLLHAHTIPNTTQQKANQIFLASSVLRTARTENPNQECITLNLSVPES